MAPRLRGVLHVAHLQERVRPVQYGAVASIAGPGLLPLLDQLLQLQIHEAVHVPARPHRRHAARKIEPDEAGAELTVDAGARGVIQVLVHHARARQHRLPREIDGRRPFRASATRPAVTHLRDVAAADHERLLFPRGRARAVDDAHVDQRDDRGVDLYEVADRVGKLRRLGGRQHPGREQEEKSHDHARNPNSAHCPLPLAPCPTSITLPSALGPASALHSKYVPEHKAALQFRPASHRRGSACGVAPVRAEDQRVHETVEGE